MDNLSNKIEIDDIIMAEKIKAEEKRMKMEMKNILHRFWMLQKEKKTVSDGQIFHLDMINERCLPIVNSLMDKPRPAPKFKVRIMPQLAIANSAVKKEDKVKMSNESESDWKDQWSE